MIFFETKSTNKIMRVDKLFGILMLSDYLCHHL